MKVDGRLIKRETVEYITGHSNYSLITLVDGTTVLSSHNLGRIATYLKLTRIHKQYAVNPKYINEIDILDRVVMRSGKMLQVSRRRRESVYLDVRQNKNPRLHR